VNEVLVHSRRCHTRTYGVPGHLWLRDESARQNAVWHAINSALSCKAPESLPSDSVNDSPRIIICSSSDGAQHSRQVVEMMQSWFPNEKLLVNEVIDDSSVWHFEILVNGVLLHSRKTQWQGFFYDDWSQQSLVWRAISDLLLKDSGHASRA